MTTSVMIDGTRAGRASRNRIWDASSAEEGVSESSDGDAPRAVERRGLQLRQRKKITRRVVVLNCQVVPTISQDNTAGQDARRRELMADYGSKICSVDKRRATRQRSPVSIISTNRQRVAMVEDVDEDDNLVTDSQRYAKSTTASAYIYRRQRAQIREPSMDYITIAGKRASERVSYYDKPREERLNGLNGSRRNPGVYYRTSSTRGPGRQTYYSDNSGSITYPSSSEANSDTDDFWKDLGSSGVHDRHRSTVVTSERQNLSDAYDDFSEDNEDSEIESIGYRHPKSIARRKVKSNLQQGTPPVSGAPSRIERKQTEYMRPIPGSLPRSATWFPHEPDLFHRSTNRRRARSPGVGEFRYTVANGRVKATQVVYATQQISGSPPSPLANYTDVQPQMNLYQPGIVHAGRKQSSSMGQQQNDIPTPTQTVASHLDPSQPIRLQPSPAYYPPPANAIGLPNSVTGRTTDRRDGSVQQGSSNAASQSTPYRDRPAIGRASGRPSYYVDEVHGSAS